jgi:hypothetical protein
MSHDADRGSSGANAPSRPAFDVACERLGAGETTWFGFSSMTQRMDSDKASAFVLDVELTGVITAVTALHPDGYMTLASPSTASED